ncbi:hypothetical protein M408DRAFT_283202 [Serendipita vermifera MAFF 305830]|uniref:Clathrin/coatomer adaptor adaptin-like N-terminal domain-containing protein n=1 Tax=Serendipita vermifera MAFF 305830 TaxID=933852 RepID=A0A0C3AD45_SERVB|nr:hypothetical protein M408DRAFT_283202 [Serendipita vermifera MAFF 305830]
MNFSGSLTGMLKASNRELPMTAMSIIRMLAQSVDFYPVIRPTIPLLIPLLNNENGEIQPTALSTLIELVKHEELQAAFRSNIPQAIQLLSTSSFGGPTTVSTFLCDLITNRKPFDTFMRFLTLYYL